MIYVAVAAIAFMASLGSIAAMLPWLRRRALARSNHRSSHVVPTPQGAGIAVVAVSVCLCAALIAVGAMPARHELAALAAGALALCAMGFADDTGGLPIGLRFAGQIAAVTAVVLVLPTDLRVLPDAVPLVVERAALAFAGLWFVNLVNFMDGIDWITFVEVTGVAGGAVILWQMGLAGHTAGLTALVLVGAMAGFAVWNRPRAVVFLGDAGSLPIGLVLVWLMIDMAGRGAWTAAVLFPLYYWADATATLLRRMLRGERFWQAHREHFYQQATRPGGRGVPRTLTAIALVDALLVALGVGAELAGGLAMRLAALGVGATLVAALLRHFHVSREARGGSAGA